MYIWFFPKYKLVLGIEMMWFYELVYLERDPLRNPLLYSTYRQGRAQLPSLCSSHDQTSFVLVDQAVVLPPAKGKKMTF